jgi:hypothetical protein
MLRHTAMVRTTAIMTMAAKKLDQTDMLTHGLAELYCGPSMMVKEGGVPANFC